MKIIDKLNKAQSKYDKTISSVEKSISDKVCFDFSIIYQKSDGFCLLHVDSGVYLASLNTCLFIIEETGKLTFEDFKPFCF